MELEFSGKVWHWREPALWYFVTVRVTVGGALGRCCQVGARAQTGRVSTPLDAKTVLQRYLQGARGSLLWKLDGLDEYQVRLPHTPTGTNLLGIVKHALNVELGYFGVTFGREWPTPEEVVSDEQFKADPQIDFSATEDETASGIADLYRRVWAFCDETIAGLPLDAIGHVPWWPPERSAVTLEHVIVHVLNDLARHAGHADVIREQIDGSAGLHEDAPNIPDGVDWPAYVTRLTELAERFRA